jgi:hypothetical protein
MECRRAKHAAKRSGTQPKVSPVRGLSRANNKAVCTNRHTMWRASRFSGVGTLAKLVGALAKHRVCSNT